MFKNVYNPYIPFISQKHIKNENFIPLYNINLLGSPKNPAPPSDHQTFNIKKLLSSTNGYQADSKINSFYFGNGIFVRGESLRVFSFRLERATNCENAINLFRGKFRLVFRFCKLLIVPENGNFGNNFNICTELITCLENLSKWN